VKPATTGKRALDESNGTSSIPKKKLVYGGLVDENCDNDTPNSVSHTLRKFAPKVCTFTNRADRAADFIHFGNGVTITPRTTSCE
jgi:hypothetical protein